MDTRANPDTERQRNRARIAADLALFLRRGGVIKQVSTGASVEGGRQNVQPCYPVRVGGSEED